MDYDTIKKVEKNRDSEWVAGSELILLWIAASPKGFSKIFFEESGLAFNPLYECIKKRLIPFIKQHYVEGEYLFWPDLVPSHYEKVPFQASSFILVIFRYVATSNIVSEDEALETDLDNSKELAAKAL
ncbi:glucosylceramidase 4 [Brachionus plicatilis]|uniref:Glucosylceramidase 4 n=1 Tax=Brachionus plicatilis TaxID=10195 RepID=A0A3M7QZG2_BRAPC|nr:glucosylceramidase 4 [Brachionus plicatilis]